MNGYIRVLFESWKIKKIFREENWDCTQAVAQIWYVTENFACEIPAQKGGRIQFIHYRVSAADAPHHGFQI